MPPESATVVDVTQAAPVAPTAEPQARPERGERRSFRLFQPSAAEAAAEKPVADEPAADAVVAKPEPKPDNADQKLANLSKRIAEQERQIRKQAHDLKTGGTAAQELAELKRKLAEDPLSVVDPDALTKRVLKGVEKPKPEEKALSEAELARKELAEFKASMAEKETKLERQGVLHALTKEIEAREDLAFSSWLGKPSEIYDRIEKFKAEHGEATPDDCEQIALEVESEVRENVLGQLRDGVKRVPKLRELVLELAKDLAPKSESKPDQRVIDGPDRRAAPVLRSKTLSTSQASAVSQRSAPVVGTRTLEEKHAAIEARLAKRRLKA